jgi:anaerobic magnesium-protoporphyrin IX monomethyl ester cyclase
MRIGLIQAIIPEFIGLWQADQPLGLGYLSSYIKAHISDVEVYLARNEKELLEGRPDLVGISAVTYNFNEAARLARLVKEQFGAFTVLGGTHITALPQSLPESFDVGIIGEGEITFLEIIRAVRNNATAAEDLKKIQGIAFRFENKIETTARRELIRPLDSLPFPDRALFATSSVLTDHVSLISSRGCPYDCAFCSSVVHWGRTIRNFSADYLIGEISQVMETYHPKRLEFVDDLFLNDKERFRKVCRFIVSSGLSRSGLTFHLTGRANNIDEETCELTKAINTTQLFIGFESMSDKVLRSLAKHGVSAEMNRRAVELLHSYDIPVNASFIIGTPGETIDDAYLNCQFVIENLEKFCHVDGGILRIFPGTKFWQDALDKGIISETDMRGVVLDSGDIDGWDYMKARYPMLTDTMTRGEVMVFQVLFTVLAKLVASQRELTATKHDIELLLSKSIDQMGIRDTCRTLLKKFYARIRNTLPS